MAVTIDDLNVVITSNAAEFKKDLEAIQEELANVGQATAGTSVKTAAWTVALQAAMKGLRMVGKAVGAVGKAFGKFIVDSAKAGSGLTRLSIATSTVASNVGMTAEEIENLRDQLADANTYGTVAENVIRTLAMSGLTKMADKLSVVDARTGELATGTTALVLQMKDLAAAAGLASSEGIERIAKFINSGDASFVNGIIEVGDLTAKYREFSQESYGVIRQLNAQEKAQARVWITTQEADKAWGAYANTNATANKAAKSLLEVIRFIKEFLGSAFEPVLGALTRSMLEFANSIRKFLRDNESAIREWAAKVAGYVIGFIRLLGSLLSKIPVIGKYFAGLASFAARPIDSLKGLGESAENTGGAIGSTADETARLNKELKGLAGFDEMNVLNKDTGEANKMGGGLFDGAGAGLGAGAGAGAGLTSVFNDAVKNANDMAKNLKPIFDEIKRVGGSIWDELKTAWNEWLRPAIGAMIEAWTDLRRELGLAGDSSDTVDEKMKPLKITIKVITGVITAAIWVVTGLIRTWAGFISIVKNVIHWLSDKLAIAILSIMRLFQDKDVIFSFATVMRNWIVNAINSIIYWFKRLTGVVGSVVYNIRNRIRSLRESLSDFGGRIVIAIKAPINGIIWRINRFLSTIRGIRIPVIAPYGIRVPNVPYLARGGVVSSPTLAQIGENGAEAVVPLENNTEWMDKIADKINQGGGLGDGNLIIKIGDETIYERAIQYIKDKSLRTGNNLLNI